MDRHRPALTRPWALLLAIPPLAFLGLFFLWPVANILALGIAPDGQLAPGSIVETWRQPFVLDTLLFTLALAGLSTLLTLLVVPSLYFPVRVVSLISIFEIQRALGLINTTSGLILPYITLNLAISVLIMRSIFEQVPHDLIEAARIDGCGAWRTLLVVGVPLITNGLVVVIIVNFVTAWGEYLLAATLTDDQAVRTLPVVLASAHGGMGQWAWPRIAAVFVIAITPGIIVFSFAQRLFFQGLMEGALKA